MNWQKVWLVLKREYLFNFKRPAFLFTAFGVPLMSLGAMFLITQFIVERETNLDSWQRIAYIDQANVIDASIQIPAVCECDYPPLDVPAAPDGAADSAPIDAGVARVQADEIDAFFVIAPDYPITGKVELYADRNVPSALQDNIENFLWYQVSGKAPDDLAVPVKRLGNNNYTIRDLDNGEALSEAALAGRFMLPFLFVMIYFMATSTTAQFLMSGVVEEKENRLMEILATSIRPLELLWGKMLGLGSLALTQVTIWLVGGLLITLINSDAQDFLAGAAFQLSDIAVIVVLFVFNFLLFAASMMGMGASVTAETESRQIAGFFTFINVLPIMLLVTFFTNPNGVIPMILTFFPFTAATALVLRLGFTTVPFWQLGLVVAIQALMAIAIMWLAAKVFRLGMLMYGKPLTPRALWRALREGRVTLTTASTEYDTPVTDATATTKRGLL